MFSYSLTKKASIYNREKTVSAASDLGKAGYLYVNSVETVSHTIHKLKMA